MTLNLDNLELALPHFHLRVSAMLEARVTALFGPSGSGKTTLLELIAGVRRPTAGLVRMGDRTLCDAAAGVFVAPEHRAIGYVPQDAALFPHLTVRGNLLYSRRARQGGLHHLTLEHVAEVLEITPRLERSVDALSGGEKQRVALGRALLAAPQLLLLDEPLAGLDASLKSRLMPYLVAVRDEFRIPMLYVTHSPAEVVQLCDDALLLKSGTVHAHGSAGVLFVRDDRPQYRLKD